MKNKCTHSVTTILGTEGLSFKCKCSNPECGEVFLKLRKDGLTEAYLMNEIHDLNSQLEASKRKTWLDKMLGR